MWDGEGPEAEAADFSQSAENLPKPITATHIAPITIAVFRIVDLRLAIFIYDNQGMLYLCPCVFEEEIGRKVLEMLLFKNRPYDTRSQRKRADLRPPEKYKT